NKAQMQSPSNIAVGSAGVYITDTGNNVVRLVNSSGNISTVAGSQPAGAGYSGDAGLATGAIFNLPYGVAVDSAGNYYIADANNNRLRKVTTDGNVNSIAGNSKAEYTGDGNAAVNAQINHPLSVQLDAAGNLYFADTGNHVIRRIGL